MIFHTSIQQIENLNINLYYSYLDIFKEQYEILDSLEERIKSVFGIVSEIKQIVEEYYNKNDESLFEAYNQEIDNFLSQIEIIANSDTINGKSFTNGSFGKEGYNRYLLFDVKIFDFYDEYKYYENKKVEKNMKLFLENKINNKKLIEPKGQKYFDVYFDDYYWLSLKNFNRFLFDNKYVQKEDFNLFFDKRSIFEYENLDGSDFALSYFDDKILEEGLINE